MEHRCSPRWRAVIEYTTLLVSDPVSWNCKVQWPTHLWKVRCNVDHVAVDLDLVATAMSNAVDSDK